MSVVISFLNSVAVSFFGSILSASFCDALDTPKKRRLFWCCMAVLPLLQWETSAIWTADFQRRIYPLVVHFPLFLMLFIFTKKPVWSAISVLTAYLCCQLRRWIALFTVALLSGGHLMQALVELLVTVPLLIFLLRFVSPAVSRLSNHPIKLQCQFGAIPALYYVFDYATVVYTDLLTGGSPVVVEFMPFVCCGAYIAFLLYSSAEERKYIRLQQIQENLDIQLKQSVREITSLRESEKLARRYRHDLRHHLQYVSACISNGQTEQAQQYISEIYREIEAQKVNRYCENEAANLILSSFAGRAQSIGVKMTVSGTLPAFILLSDTDLCVILSNALENALTACKDIVVSGGEATIDVRFYERENRFFLQVTNPCNKTVQFKNDIPVSDRPNHGIGVQSICAIVQKHGGVSAFSVKDGQFILRLSV